MHNTYTYIYIKYIDYIYVHAFVALGEAIPPAPTSLQTLLQAYGFGGGIPKIPANLVLLV